MVVQGDITYLQVVGSIIVVKLNDVLTRKGKELKAPHYASAAATRNYITIRDIVPTLTTFLLWLPSIYKYHLTSALNKIL